ncbi:MAG TPA: hypothetical protein PKL73_16495 [Polyangiaceae bacterium]|nr:hypothetical protein [Polyangiaceae bacterium]HOD24604.1 hypothetical protein [Polyangiaceae bacterium]HOE50207.1 hypothetical protein [Polyangiaceae bacterium]HOH02970.1 hypothetical protein [Polyangiaceae bacterium]HOR37698.1 hypothetical protein [Polyangiaceae bacterium]
MPSIVRAARPALEDPDCAAQPPSPTPEQAPPRNPNPSPPY